MYGIVMDAEKSVSYLLKIYKRLKVAYGEDNKEFTLPALAALKNAEKVRDSIKSIVPYL